jgi:hypothetical protein
VAFQQTWSTNARLLLKATVLLVLVFALVRFSGLAWRVITTALLVLAPLFPFSAFLTARVVLAPSLRATLSYRPSPPSLHAAPASLGRVLVLIFDEMDQRLTFVNRPPGVDLPELERFRRESFYASAAHSPGGETLVSIPALISGRRVVSVSPHPEDLMIKYEGTTVAVPWSAQPNLFSEAIQLGANTGLVGFYHPYCRILGGNLTTCTVAETGWGADASIVSNGLLGVLDQYRFVDTMLSELTHVGVSLDRVYVVRAYREMRDRAIRLACDPRIQMVFLHWPTPHPPGIYNRTTHRLTTIGPSDYFDNLVLADKTLGEMRRAMEAAGVWEPTTVILTADHHLRVEMWRDRYGPLPMEVQTATGGKSRPLVPFIVKLAGQNHSVVYDAPFNGIVLHDLALSFLQRKINTPEGVASWLNENRSRIGLN